MREETRRERYAEKAKVAKTYPIYLAAINFQHDTNLAFLIRSAACFGIKEVLLLGSHPPRALMNELSGSMFDYVKLKQFGQPGRLLEYLRENGIQPVALELPGETYVAHSIHDYQFNFDKPVCIITGHESAGVPGDLLLASEVIYVPMPGIGFCLNTAQTATVAIYEAVKQYENER